MSSGYSSYSEFGQKWARRIPDHWEAKRLKAIFAMRKERNNPVITNNILSLTAKQGVVPYSEKEGAGGNKPKDDMTKYNIAHENDLLVNCMNVVSGSAGVSRYYGAISPVYYALYPRNDENVWYYHYIFRLLSFQRSLIGLGKGILMHESENGKLNTVRMRISMDYLGNVLLPIPPRSEQDQIVRYLEWKVSNINKLINIQKKQVRIIEELKEKVACEALLHGIDDGISYKDSGIAWIGSIPEHWKVIKIKWLFDEADERNTDETAELLTFSKKRGLIPFSEASEKKPSASDLSNYKLLHIGQLLENRMQAWHGMFICADREGCVSPDYSVFSASKEREVNVKFYEYAFRSHVWVEQFANASRGVGSGFNRLYTPQFGAIYTVYPDINEQNRIVEYLDRKMAQLNVLIEQIEERIEGLEELKTTLVSDVVTGKIDVRDVEIPEYEFVDEDVDADSGSDDDSDDTEEQEE